MAIKVVFWEVSEGAISRFQNDRWDHEPVVTLDHQTSKWVPALVDGSEHIWIQSGSSMEVPMPPLETTPSRGS